MSPEEFIANLSAHRPKKGEYWFNPYRGNTRVSRIRRNNLLGYLNKMKKSRPRRVLVAEAPGYKGCALTGIPFSSEKLLLEHPFFKSFPNSLIDENRKAFSEQSATIVWKALDSHSELPLIWNIFPFHPYQKGNRQSNRPPLQGELQRGAKILMELMQCYDIEQVAAVGRKAETTLGKFGIEASYIRHPSRGGKKEFKRGIDRFLGK